MRKEVNSKRVQDGRAKSVTDYYDCFKRINNWHMRLAVPVLVIFALLLLAIPFFNSKKNSMMKETRTEIAQLQQQKEDKLAEIKSQPKANFSDSVKQKKNDYANDFNSNSDYYTADINGNSIQIDRNNIFVSDNAGVLSSQAKQKVYELNRQLDANANGAQFMVVTISHLPSGEDIESYATDIFNTLGIGNKEEDNGVLYLMSISEKKTRLEVGYGMEPTLTDSNAQDILDDDDVVDDYQDSNYSAGVMRTTDLVANYMNSQTPYEDGQIHQGQEFLNMLPILFTVLYVFIIGVFLLFLWYISSIRKTRKELTEDYNNLNNMLNDNDMAEDARLSKIDKMALYTLVFYGMLYWQTYRHMKKSARLGSVLLQNPGSKKIGGRVLSGDTLYDTYGNILTTHYYTSSYHHTSSSGGSGGGFGGGSFGGGSSGGGGASGGW